MKTKIMSFGESTGQFDKHGFCCYDFMGAKERALENFDKWRNESSNRILAINFGFEAGKFRLDVLCEVN